jgi:kynurenine formamidase
VEFIDLSAPLRQDPPDWPDALRVDVVAQSHAEGAAQIEQLLGVPPHLLRAREGWATEHVSLGTHSTTHVDAPWHYNSTIAGARARAIDELPLEWFFGPGVVIDATDRADGEALTAGDVEERLPRGLDPGDIVLVHTGRDAALGEPQYPALGPGVTYEATRWLHERGVRVMGIDAWGWDAPLHLQAAAAKEADRPGIFWAAHQADLEYCQIERLCNLAALPPTGFRVACFPLKVEGGSAGPARVVALVG